MIHFLLFDNPGTLFIAIFAIMLAVVSRSSAAASSLRTTAALCATLGICAFALVDAMNVSRGGMLWHDAANILSIAAAYIHGQTVYPARGAAEFYSLFYGPYAYLVYAPFLEWFSSPFLWMRLAISCANAASLLLLYRALRCFLSRVDAAGLLVVAVAVLLARPNELLGYRGDCWLFLCVSLVVFLLVRSRAGLLSMLVAGLACGVAAGIKITVLPVVVLALYAIFTRRGARAFGIAVVGFAISALGVFLLPHISVANYADALRLAGHQRFLRSTLLGNLAVSAMLLAPLAALLRRRHAAVTAFRRERVLWLLGALAFGASALTGSKDSAGFWHLWPIMPFVLVATAYEIAQFGTPIDDGKQSDATLVRSKSKWIAVTLTAASVAGGITALYFAQKDFRVLRPLATSFWKGREADALAELQQTAHAPHARNLSMGYGGDITDYRTNLRYVLPLADQNYFFDENEVVESIKEKLPVPAHVLARVLSCEDDWLVPHGEVPFSALRVHVLPPGDSPYIFPNELRLGFPATHTLLAQGTFYDRWGCDSNEAKASSLY